MSGFVYTHRSPARSLRQAYRTYVEQTSEPTLAGFHSFVLTRYGRVSFPLSAYASEREAATGQRIDRTA
jgi:hypothetical protein